jgi:hypothetical protein
LRARCVPVAVALAPRPASAARCSGTENGQRLVGALDRDEQVVGAALWLCLNYATASELDDCFHVEKL